MERLLRGKEIHQITKDVDLCLNPGKELLIFPVSHYSPACARHLEKTIQSFDPDLILVEGPDNADALVPELVHPDTRLPAAFYCSFNDRKGVLNDKKERHTAYYPFLDYSPETVALREAAKRGIPSNFIDLPYHEILLRRHNRFHRKDRSDIHGTHLTHNLYLEQLKETDHCRNIHEFHEKWFEINAFNIRTTDYIKQLVTYACMVRSNASEDELLSDATIEREQHMAGNIRRLQQGQRTLVVAGAMHVPGIAGILNRPADAKRSRSKTFKESTGIYLMPYTFTRCDRQTGSSGVFYPAYNQEVWENRRTESPFEKSAITVITKLSRRLRDLKLPVSLADEIESHRMIRQLAGFRGKCQGGVFELMDAIQSTCVKGEMGPENSLLAQLDKVLTGRRTGQLCEEAKVPPLVKDYLQRIVGFRLKTGSGHRPLVLDIYKKDRHKEISRFFHCMQYLETGFAKKIKGPDPMEKTGRSLVRETWEYRQDPAVITRLIDICVCGGTIEEAAGTLVTDDLAMASNHVAIHCRLFTRACLMGLERQFPLLLNRAGDALQEDGYFDSLITGYSDLVFLYYSGYLLPKKWQPSLAGLMKRLYNKTVSQIPFLAGTPDQTEMDMVDHLKTLYQNTIQEISHGDMDLYIEMLELLRGADPCNPALDGAATGILYGADAISGREVIHRLNGYLRGTGEKFFDTSRFLSGLFACSRDLFLFNSQFIDLITDQIANLDEALFIEVLPSLRLAFSFFTPREVKTIGQRIRLKYHSEARDVTLPDAGGSNGADNAGQLDRAAQKRLIEMGLGQ